MPEKILVPAIEKRLSGFIEVSRRSAQKPGGKSAAKPTITISREFGCEAYPVAEQVRNLMEQRTGEQWLLIDKALLAAVAGDRDLSANGLHHLGQRPRWLDDMLSTLTPRWKNEKDHYKLLCEQIVAIAQEGNAVIVGLGSAIIAQELPNCHHFRLFASPEFKVNSIARRMKISMQDAEILIEKRQKERDRFIRNFLDVAADDLHFYQLVFNNDRNSTAKIAATITNYVLAER
jgi:cytidylate kinase